MLEIAKKESALADTVAQQFVETPNQSCKKLKAKIDQVRKLKELELHRLLQDCYRYFFSKFRTLKE